MPVMATASVGYSAYMESFTEGRSHWTHLDMRRHVVHSLIQVPVVVTLGRYPVQGILHMQSSNGLRAWMP